MRIETLDHVALWVADREALASFAVESLGMHVIDRTERFTLVGADARRGKLTLFAADEGPREPGALGRIVLRVDDVESALRRLPADTSVEHRDGVASFTGPEGLGLGFAQRPGVPYDIEQVVLRVQDPPGAFDQLATLGFDSAGGRLAAGDVEIVLDRGAPSEPEHPLLNHLGLRVESADDHLAEARERGLEIADVVDGPNTYAVFVWGPGRIKLEYVEHKPNFSLV